MIGAAGLQHWVRERGDAAAAAGRTACIGMGGGSIPMFLAHHFPQLQVRSLRGLVPALRLKSWTRAEAGTSLRQRRRIDVSLYPPLHQRNLQEGVFTRTLFQQWVPMRCRPGILAVKQCEVCCAQVDTVDLDPVVMAAARKAMGFPADR